MTQKQHNYSFKTLMISSQK